MPHWAQRLGHDVIGLCRENPISKRKRKIALLKKGKIIHNLYNMRLFLFFVKQILKTIFYQYKANMEDQHYIFKAS